jgi:hypothetical protein
MSKEEGYTVDELFAEGESDVLLEELMSTEWEDDKALVEKLKEFPGAGDSSDEELLQLFNDAVAAKGEAGKEAGEHKEDAEVYSLPEVRRWKLLDGEGNEVGDVSKLSAADVLQLRIGYRAVDKDQVADIEELVRMAQVGHGSGRAHADLTRERDEALAAYRELQPRLAQMDKERDIFHRAMVDPAYRELLVQAFQENLNAPAPAPDPYQQMADERVLTQQSEQMVDLIKEHVVVPRAQALAEAYGADADEVAQEILRLSDKEYEAAPEFWNEAKFQVIVNEGILASLESAGYRAKSEVGAFDFESIVGPAGESGMTPASGLSPAGNRDAVAEMEAKMAAMEEKLAAYETNASAVKVAGSPPGDVGGAVGDAGESGGVSLDGLESADDMLAELRK